MYASQNNNPNAQIPPELQSIMMNYSGQQGAVDPQQQQQHQQQQQMYLQAMLLQQQQQQQQQQDQGGSLSPYDSQQQMQRAKSAAQDVYGSASSSPSMNNMQRFGSPLAANHAMTSPQQAKVQKDDQTRRQSTGTPRQRSASATNISDPSSPNETVMNAKRVSAVSTI